MWLSLMDYLNNLNCWDWFSLALFFLLLEVFVNVAFFLWFAIAAGTVGVLVLMAPYLSWQTQLTFFAIGFITSMLMWMLYCRSKSRSQTKAAMALGCKKNNYVGRTFSLNEAIHNGSGRLLVDDVNWVIKGPDAEEGATVKVVAMENSALRVEKIKP